MRFKYIFQHKTLMVKWLITYILVISVPVAVSMLVYIETKRVIENQIIKTNNLLLNQVKQTLDEKLNDLTRLVHEIMLNQQISRIAGVHGKFTNEDQLDLIEIKKYLAHQKIVNGFISEIYIYFKNTDKTITTATQANGKETYDFFHNKDGMSYQQWSDYIKRRFIYNLVPFGSIETGETSEDTISLLQSLPDQNANQCEAALVIMISKKEFTEIVQNFPDLNSGRVVFMDDNNHILFSTKGEDESFPFKYKDFNEDVGIVYEKLNGKNVVISHVTSGILKIKYMYAISSAVFWQASKYIRVFISVGICLFIIIGLSIALYFSKKNYMPINEIMNNIIRKVPLPSNKQYNEFNLIQDVLNTTFHEKEKVERKLEQQNNILRNNFLVKLLSGKMRNYQNITEILQMYDIHFHNECFVVAILVIEDYKRLFKDDFSANPEEQLNLVRFAISNVVEEIIGECYPTVMLEVDDDVLTCIINGSISEKHKMQSDVVELIKESRDFLEENLCIDFSTSVGLTHETIHGIPQAYQEALDVLEYKNMSGHSQEILCYSDIKSFQLNYNYDYPTEVEYKLINCIKSGDFEQAKITLDDIFEHNFKDEKFSVEFGKCMKYDILSSILKVINNEQYSALMEELRPVYRITNTEAIDEVKRTLLEIMEKICIIMKENKKKGNHHKLGTEVEHYINEHYNDINLSVFMIGEHFEMTPHYLSKLFKEQTDKNLLDYINTVRVAKAKEFLKNNSLNVSQVAQEVGYANAAALIRIFKKYEGITPGKFRELEDGFNDMT